MTRKEMQQADARLPQLAGLFDVPNVDDYSWDQPIELDADAEAFLENHELPC
jgi:hypothetical protein